MSARLIITIVSTVAEEAAILFLGLWFLPEMDVRVPVPIVVGIAVAWLGWTIFTYQKGTNALLRKPVRGLADMAGMKGVVVRELHPEGHVKVGGELWKARSTTGKTDTGTRIVVVSRNGMKLVVRPEESDARSRPVDR